MSRVVELCPSDTGAGVPKLTERATGPLGSGQIRVAVSVGGVNFWEVMQLRGQVATESPTYLGTEGAGVVREVAPDVQGFAVGDRVAWTRNPGSFGDEVVGAATSFFPVPDDVDDHTAAGLLFQGMTAHYLDSDSWPLESGATAVVTAAAGGVGLILTQILVSRGIQVIGIVSSQMKRALVLEYGAAHALTYDQDLEQEIRAIVPNGVDAVYDSVGGEVAETLVPALKVQGAMVLYGAAGGAEADIPLGVLAAGSRYLTRTQGRHFTGDPEVAARRAEELFAMVVKGALRVHVGGTWPVTAVDAAIEALAGRKTVGKVLITP